MVVEKIMKLSLVSIYMDIKFLGTNKIVPSVLSRRYISLNSTHLLVRELQDWLALEYITCNKMDLTGVPESQGFNSFELYLYSSTLQSCTCVS